MKVRLNADGTFLFAGTTYKSEGTYSVKDGKLALEWTEVDGQHVKPGTMHKLLALTADMCSFTIDRYTYGKHVDVVAAQN